MNVTLTRKANSGGKILEPGTLLDLPEGKARKLIDLGLARQAVTLFIDSWVTFGSPPDQVGQIVRLEEGVAIVRVFNQFGGHHDFRCPIDTLKPIAPPESPLPAIPAYRVGEMVRYCHKTALNVQNGTITEIKPFPAGAWYRIKDGDALRWVGEMHIQGVINNGVHHAAGDLQPNIQFTEVD